MRILVFDSGIGGLPTATALRALLPDAELIYLADNAGFPYGEQPDAALTAGILAVIARALPEIDPDMVVIACNTASTVALAALRARFAIPFVGCVPPVKWAAAVSRTRVIGLLATPATVRRPYLQDLIRNFAGDCQVLSHGAPGLATMAEAKFRGDPIDPASLRAEIAGMVDQEGAELLDAVALGCTHYALLLPELRAALPAHVTWLDPAPRVAAQAARVAAARVAAPHAPVAGNMFFTGAAPESVAGWSAAGFQAVAVLDKAGIELQQKEVVLF